MNKVLGVIFAIYLLGDPGMGMLASIGLNAEYVFSLMVALVTIPWVTAQLER